ncbi:unnamed protein product [Mytilus coruscus]|uniref:PRRT1 n=1 Tax=Mytilus coruscus TaxID=42192 RepID=A0A6J8E4H2_MYTCO|nr:unnamed protein product [Mytilus coruscus]
MREILLCNYNLTFAAQSSNCSKIPLNEYGSKPYHAGEVQPDQPDKSPSYHEKYDDKQQSHTLLENQNFAKPESSSAYNLLTSMVNPEKDTPHPYTSVDHICVETDISPPYNSVPVNVDQPSTSVDPCVSENQSVKIATTKRPRRDENPRGNPEYICGAICACVCCCMPLGLVAVYAAYQANKARANRDYDAARRYNNKAFNWTVASYFFGIAFFIFAIFRILFKDTQNMQS